MQPSMMIRHLRTRQKEVSTWAEGVRAKARAGRQLTLTMAKSADVVAHLREDDV